MPLRKTAFASLGPAAAIAGLLMLVPCQAADVDALSPGDVDGIRAVMAEFGPAVTGVDETTGRHIDASLADVGYQVFLLPCTPAADTCLELNFYAGFAGLKPPMDLVNQFNRTHRFARAYLDRDLDAAIEMDLGITDSVSRSTLRAAISRWAAALSAYVETLQPYR